jgi:hypothetical protein
MKVSYMTIKRGPRLVTTGGISLPFEHGENDIVAGDFLASDEEEVYLVLWNKLVEATGGLKEWPGEPDIKVACTLNSVGWMGPESVLSGRVGVRRRIYR